MQSLISIFKQSPLCWTISLKKGRPQRGWQAHRTMQNLSHTSQNLICHLAHGKNSRSTQVVGVYGKHDIILYSLFVHCQHFCRTYLKRLDYVLILEVPDEDLGVATPTDQVAAAVQETAASEAPTTFLWGGGGGGGGRGSKD